MTQPTTQPATGTLYCANHPDRETLLRCNRCDKPICYQCAVQTPVGYRCRECVNQQQAKYYNGESYDVPLAAVIALVSGGIAGVLAYLFLGAIGWFSYLIAFVAGPAVGGAVAEVVRRGLHRRRAQGMKAAATGAFVVGVLLGGFVLYAFPALAAGMPLGAVIGALPRLFFRLDVILLTFLAASTLYARIL